MSMSAMSILIERSVSRFHRLAKGSLAWLLGALLLHSWAPLASADVYGHWPLDDGQGDLARDLGPRMENATIFDFDVDGLGPNGSIWVDDPERGAVLGLGGNTAWVSAGSLPLMDLQNDFSWSFWARQPPEQA